ncbi:hypothetical protein [Sulfolobus acidocaldarius]|uniref:hypothetical protein n=1 Tax=Sulfolobus acidocaldarius TaxID=2285 RepID=UPI000784C9B3|nr:hypothetical protein [Sulfolobus acidocaldarius]
MIIGIGRSPIAYRIRYTSFNNSKLLPYPLFYDNKKLLLTATNGYIYYLKELVKLKNIIKVALWPDNIDLDKAVKVVDISLLENITFVVPVHSLEQLEIVDKLKEFNFRVFTGYASDKKYRNYELGDFIKAAKTKKWYLGVSTKKELRELLMHNFDGFDITGYLFGTHENRKDFRVLMRNLEELLRTVSKPQGKQTTIFDFLENRAVNWGV